MGPGLNESLSLMYHPHMSSMYMYVCTVLVRTERRSDARRTPGQQWPAEFEHRLGAERARQTRDNRRGQVSSRGRGGCKDGVLSKSPIAPTVL